MPDALVCCLSGIGNCISTIPLVRALKELGYNVDMRIAAERGARPIFASLPEVRRVYNHGSDMPKYDVACCTHLCHAYHDGSCKVADRIMMIEPGLEKDFSPFSINRYRKHEIEYCVDLARQLGFMGPVPQTKFEVGSVKDPGVTTRKDVGRYPIAIGVGHHKGDDFSKLKHWGNDNFAELLDKLHDGGFIPVILGNDADEPNVSEILEKTKLEKDRVISLVGKPLMEQLKAFLNCKLCLTNETMWTVASSAGIPCISMVFEEAHHNELKTYPYPSGVALVGRRSEMTPDVVYKALLRVWDDGEPKRWSKVVNVGDTAVSIRKSSVGALRAGFGIKGGGVSIVALLFDKANHSLFDVCSRCVAQVRDTAPKDAEIVLVCNEPSDKLRDLVKWSEKIDDRVVGISTNQNVGVVVKNFGYNLARGDYIISIDSDVFPEAGWVEKVVGFMEKHPELGLVAPCGGRLRVDKWGPEDWPCGNYADNGPQSYLGYENAEYFGAQTATGRDGEWLDVAPSMCWGFRRELLEKIGYLDWRFGPFVGSDADFCFRVKKAGYGVAVCRIPIRHVGCGGSTHAMFSDLEDLRMDHIRELRKRWYQHAHKLCGLYKTVGGYVPPPPKEVVGG